MRLSRLERPRTPRHRPPQGHPGIVGLHVPASYRMAGCATPTGSSRHAPAGARASPQLTSQADHSVGPVRVATALREKGATLKATEQPIDTSTAAGKCFLDMLGVFAEFETNLRRERQMEGIAKAKAAGVYKGRKRSIDASAVPKLREEGFGPAAIAKHLKIGRASVYRLRSA